MITIDDLIKQLQTFREFHGNIGVILQGDSEGNSFESIRGAEFGFYNSDSEYVYSDLDEAIGDGHEFEDLQQVVVIYP